MDSASQAWTVWTQADAEEERSLLRSIFREAAVKRFVITTDPAGRKCHGK
jgi:hypothetical protein